MRIHRKRLTALVGLLLALSAVPLQAQFTQQGMKLVGSGATGVAGQGAAVAMSADGNTAIVGGPSDNSGVGAVWIWTRSNGTWTQQGTKLVPSDLIGTARVGSSVGLSADGNTAIAGGYGDNSDLGAAWVWTRSGGVWTQQGGKLVGSGSLGSTVRQGLSVALSSDGNTAIVGGPTDNSIVGAAWIFTRSAGAWTQQGNKLVASDVNLLGYAVALSADGNTAIAGIPSGEAGAVVFTRSGGTWTQQGSKFSGSDQVYPSSQGYSVSISSDGNTAVIGGLEDDSNFGAAWVFVRSGNSWTQQGPKLFGSDTVVSGASPNHGSSVSIAGDGNVAIEGAPGDNTDAGAVWVFIRSGTVWSQQGLKLVGSGGAPGSRQGSSSSLSADGGTLVVGAPGDNSSVGAAWIFTAPTVPGAPTNVTGTPGNEQVMVSWSAPTTDGGSAIIGYQVQVATSPGGPFVNASACPTNSTATSCTATGLTNGTPHFFRVAAINETGQGAYSQVSSGVTPRTVPDQPTNVSAVPGNARATVSFTAPVDNGGAPITSYTAAATPGGASASGSSSPLIVTGLENGTAYTFTVTAANAAGSSPASSASAPVTPSAMFFTDHPLLSGITPIKAVHLTELRQRIDGVRVAHRLSSYSWTDPAPAPGATLIRAVHVIEMRSALHEAYVQASRTPPTYANPSLGPGTVITVSHFAELRDAVIAIE